MAFNEIVDRRAMTDKGAAIYIKKTTAQGAGTNGLYSLLVPITEMPALGSAPDQQETTVTTAFSKTYVPSRSDNPQIEVTAFAHRDNFTKLAAWAGIQAEFLFLNPDLTGFKRSGYISFYQDAFAVGDNITMKISITVTDATEIAVLDCKALIEDTVAITTVVPALVEMSGAAATTYKINIATNPSDATVTVTSGTAATATVAYATGVITITSVASGTTIIDVKVSKTAYADNHTYILVQNTVTA